MDDYLSDDDPAWNYLAGIDEDSPSIQQRGETVAREGIKSKKYTRNVDKFDIILYLQYHGTCDEVNRAMENVFTPRVSLSVLRASSFGVASPILTTLKPNSDVSHIVDNITYFTDKNPSKVSVFTHLQKLLRFHKQVSDDLRDSRIEANDYRYKRDVALIRSEPGWEFVINGKQFFNVKYKNDPTFLGCTVVYAPYKPKGYAVGSKIPLSLLGLLSLSKLVDYLARKGYKNIGVIEDTCHSNSATPRQNVLMKHSFSKKNVNGGKKKKRTRKRR